MILRDGYTFTTELQKGKYVYYRCSHGRGKCDLPYMREEYISERMGELLKQIYVPKTIARAIVNSLDADLNRSEAERQQQSAGFRNTSILRLWQDEDCGRDPLAPGQCGRPHRAAMARPRVACHHAEVFGAVEGNGEGAGEDEDAVLAAVEDFAAG
jgi:hypothetical protein